MDIITGKNRMPNPIATPEYNWSVPGGLKNAIDQASTAGALTDSREAESATAFSAALGD